MLGRGSGARPRQYAAAVAVIVLGHGLFSDTSFDTAQAAALRDAGHRVIAVDLRGHGRSPVRSRDPADYTFAALACDLAAALDASGVGGPVVAMGGSLGAAAALAFARRFPARCAALVLLQPAFLYGPRTELADIARLGRERGLVGLWRRVTGDEEAVRRVAAQDEGAVLAAAEGLGRDALLDGPADLEAVTQPTLVVGTPGDKLHPMAIATEHWRRIPTSRLVTETPGDVPLWDRPADLAEQVTRFLREVGVD